MGEDCRATVSDVPATLDLHCAGPSGTAGQRAGGRLFDNATGRLYALNAYHTLAEGAIHA